MEDKIALSGTPPQVVDVIVSSTQWTPAFVEFLDPQALGIGGYSVPVGSSAQEAALPWNNIDQIRIRFSEDVHVQASDLSVTGTNITSYAFSDFHYDPQSRLATWTLAAPLSKDRLMLDLDANGIDPVIDLQGNVLDGEWSNNVSVYASGDGNAGGDFEFRFNVNPADVNSSGQVTNLDYMLTRSLEGKSTTSSGYNAKYDVNGSGTIDATDWQYVLGKVGNALPSGVPAGVGNDAPSAKRIERVEISNDAVDVAIGLWNSFSDVEDGASGLTYSIQSNSNPSLFDSLTVNQSTGALTVNAASAVSGRANLKISATDSGGISTSTELTIDVNYVNQPPYLALAIPEPLAGNTWKISGVVTDPDDDLEDFIIVFSNVFYTRSAVYPDGTFEFTVILEGDPYGWEDAITWDPHGLKSNLVSVPIGFS